MNPARLYQASATLRGGSPHPTLAARRPLAFAPAVHLFVYGTLRCLAAHPMHALLRAGASFEGPARVRGVLHRVGDYPGLVLDPDAGWVVGELYWLRDPAVLGPLDAYEGAGMDDPEPREFRRVRATVEPRGQAPLVAWVYEYGWSTEGLAVIASGDFLEGR